MADQNTCDPGRPQASHDLVANVVAEVGVEIAEGLVHQHDDRLGCDRSRERHPLLLPAGQLMGVSVEVVQQTEKIEYFAGAFRASPLRSPVEPEHDVFSHRQMREERVVLKDHAHPALFRRNPVTVSRNGCISDPNRPLIRSFEPCDQSQGRGLATSARAQQREDLTVTNIQRNAGQGLHGPRPITLSHIFQVDNWHIGKRD